MFSLDHERKVAVVRMTKRRWLALSALVLSGAGASYVLQITRPVGRLIPEHFATAAALSEDGAPEVLQGAADVTLVVYSDYQCPACRKADRQMRAAVSQDGNIRLVYREWPVFGELSERAAKVALASQRQGIYDSVHSALMSSPTLSDVALRNAVAEAGGSWAQLEVDLVRYRVAIENQLDLNRKQAFSLGLKGTPAYLIDSFLVEGTLSEGEFLRAFAQARAES